MSPILTLNPEQATESEIASFSTREAARAVVIDDAKRVALLHVRKHNYYKFPGGGIEKGESIEEALLRECIEETGCVVSIGELMGTIVEYRKIFNLVQTSHCFLASVVKVKSAPTFTESEAVDDFELVFVPFDEVQSFLEIGYTTPDFEGREYITPRELCIFSAVQKMLLK